VITQQENAFICGRCYKEHSAGDKCVFCGTTREADRLQAEANAKSGIRI
jgi:methionyl-tRNA synthetase